MCVQPYRRGLEWDMTTVRRRCDNIVYCVVYDCPFRKIDNFFVLGGNLAERTVISKGYR